MGSGVSSHDAADSYSIDLGQVLGRGSISIVYIATMNKFERTAMDGRTLIPKIVAIKVVDKKSISPEEYENELKECKFFSTLRNDYVAKIYEYYETDAGLHVVMEYLPGGNLYEQVRERGCFSETDAALIVGQVTSFACALAEQGFAHRDIRGDNVVFTEASHTWIKLCNYGSKQLVKRSVAASTSGKIPLFRGSSRKLSLWRGSSRSVVIPTPERGQTDIDIWGIGVLLYHMLSGRFPFQCEETRGEECFWSSVHGPFHFQGNEWKNVSQEAKCLIVSLLRGDPEKSMMPNDILQDPWMIQNCDMRMVHASGTSFASTLSLSESRDDRNSSLSNLSTRYVS